MRFGSTERVLEIQGLAFLDYGPFDLSLRPGEVLGITGASGSGKTLFVKAIADLIDSRGQVRLDGESKDDRPAPAWRRSVMLAPAEPLWWFETVGRHFPEDRQALDCDALGLAGDVLTWPVSRLSSGEKQRLGLARVLARRPRVLLLDEPTANLDETNTGLVERCILAFLDDTGGSAIWISHDRKQLDRVAGSQAIMAGGRLTMQEARA